MRGSGSRRPLAQGLCSGAQQRPGLALPCSCRQSKRFLGLGAQMVQLGSYLVLVVVGGTVKTGRCGTASSHALLACFPTVPTM